MSPSSLDEPIGIHGETRAVAEAARHSSLWLFVANIISVGIAVLLLLPGLNAFLGQWTHGRWMMVQMNLELYGWTSLPLVGFLFRIYRADRAPTAKWCRPVLSAYAVFGYMLATPRFQHDLMMAREELRAKLGLSGK